MEMKTQELRIGNILHDRKNRLCKVEEIKEEQFYAPAIKGGMTSLPNKAIPLTEQWLIDFGFEKVNKNDRYFLLRKELGSTINNKGKEAPLKIDLRQIDSNKYLLNNIFSKTIRLTCVHQLQNLYFALTGEELTIKS